MRRSLTADSDDPSRSINYFAKERLKLPLIYQGQKLGKLKIIWDTPTSLPLRSMPEQTMKPSELLWRRLQPILIYRKHLSGNRMLS